MKRQKNNKKPITSEERIISLKKTINELSKLKSYSLIVKNYKSQLKELVIAQDNIPKVKRSDLQGKPTAQNGA